MSSDDLAIGGKNVQSLPAETPDPVLLPSSVPITTASMIETVRERG